MSDFLFLNYIFQSPQISNTIGIIELMSARAKYYGEGYSFRMVEITSFGKSFFKITGFRKKIPLSSETKIVLLNVAKLRYLFGIPFIENTLQLEIPPFFQRLNIENYPEIFKKLKNIPRTGPAFVIWKIGKKKIDVKEIYFLENKKT